MEGRKEYQLGDIVSLVIDYRGKTPLKLGGKWSNVGYRALSAKNIKTGRIVNEESIRFVDENLYKKWMKDEVCKGDILITSEAPFGQIFYWNTDEKIVLSQRLFCIRLTDKVDPQFVYYYMTTTTFQGELDGRATGTTVVGLRQPELLKCKIELPSLSVQCKIASILSSLDDKIEVNRRINENLEQQAQALFKSWFIDFEPFKDGNFVDSELGRIPEGWKLGAFTDVVTILGGGTPRTTTNSYWGGTIPFFTPKDTGDSCFCILTEKTITEEGLNNCNSKLYPIGSVFITARGTVGKVVMAGTSMAMNQSCYALRGKENFSQEIVYLQTLRLVERIKQKSNGAVFAAITARDFDEDIVIPNSCVLKDFHYAVKPLFDLVLRNIQENQNLIALRDTLLPKLMSGEIELKD